MVIGEKLDLLGDITSVRIAALNDFAEGQVGLPLESNANSAIIRIDHLNPVNPVQIHYVHSRVTKNHAVFVDAILKNIEEILSDIVLKAGQVCHGRLGNTSAVKRPAFVPVINIDQVVLRKVLGSIHGGGLDVIDERLKTVQFTGMAELTGPASAGHIANVQISAAAQRIDGLLNQLLGLRPTLLRHQD